MHRHYRKFSIETFFSPSVTRAAVNDLLMGENILQLCGAHARKIDERNLIMNH